MKLWLFISHFGSSSCICRRVSAQTLEIYDVGLMSSCAKCFVSLSLLFSWTWLGSCVCYLSLRASQFKDIIDDVGVTSSTYIGHAGQALSLLSGHRCGNISVELCKKVLAEMHPNSQIQDATQGFCCNGQRRAPHQSEYDFLFDGRRIECKSSVLSWDMSLEQWFVRFSRIKLPYSDVREQAPFDDLYVLLISPDHVDIIKHDLKTRVSKHSHSRSCRVCIRGKGKVECWRTARVQILDKLLSRDSGCSLVAQVDLTDPALQSWLSKRLGKITTVQDVTYSGVPLSSMTSSDRGLRIEQIARSLDQTLQPGCAFSSSAKVDWVRTGLGVEVGV